jgi:hypothetical protein
LLVKATVVPGATVTFEGWKANIEMSTVTILPLALTAGVDGVTVAVEGAALLLVVALELPHPLASTTTMIAPSANPTRSPGTLLTRSLKNFLISEYYVAGGSFGSLSARGGRKPIQPLHAKRVEDSERVGARVRP